MRHELTVLVCRGCCCGQPTKHPDIDHDGHRDAIGAAVDACPGATLRVVGCLGECSSSNLVVLRPHANGPATWVPQVNGDSRLGAVTAWIEAGGPGRSPEPAELRGSTFVHAAPRHLRDPRERRRQPVTMTTPEESP
ncbi:MAG: (2Fe-2S) ferredoxin domain-containing protein [Acidimicrobiales bacterium]